MMLEGISPLVISALRLVVITMLFAANCGAVCHTFRVPKYHKGKSYKWITILTILILNLTYLSIIWAPFTITTFKYNLQDLHKPASVRVEVQAPPTYILEYLRRRNGSVVHQTRLGTLVGETSAGQLILPEGKGSQELITVDFDSLNELQQGFVPPAPAASPPQQQQQQQVRHSRLGDSLNQWLTHVQDLVTSSFTFSLILITVVRKIMADKGGLMGGLRVTLLSFLMALMPIPLTVATRTLANTTTQFAIHTSEVSENGYTMYSIICDVSITQNYVVGVFLECTVVLLMATLLLMVTMMRVNHRHTNQADEDTGDVVQVEEVACKFVLVLGVGWAWPIKPLIITILYCVNGAHWSNVVCWLANMVVAVPVVFMPLSVFLSHPEPDSSTGGYDTFVDDPENTETGAENHYPQQCTENEIQNDVKDVDCKLVVKVEGLSPVEKSFVSSDTPNETLEKGSQARENLKFYLDASTFKHKKEDEVCILTKSCLAPDSNDATVESFM